MGDGSSTEDAKSAGMSPLRLRVGVFLILLWILPFWLLAEPIAHSLSGLSNPPSVVAVTTAIVVVQTILGLLGFWVAGTQVKSIIKGSAKLRAIGAIWSMLLHGEIRGQGGVGDDPNEGRPPREDAQDFAPKDVVDSRYRLSDATGSEAKHAELRRLNEAKLSIIQRRIRQALGLAACRKQTGAQSNCRWVDVQPLGSGSDWLSWEPRFSGSEVFAEPICDVPTLISETAAVPAEWVAKALMLAEHPAPKPRSVRSQPCGSNTCSILWNMSTPAPRD